MSSGKKYGLILPEKSQPLTFQARRNVFGNDSDSEDESSKKPMLLRPSANVNRQAKISQEKAILDDPTVYQYDEIYDSMAIKKEEEKSKNKEVKMPKYIENLLKTANKRKIENERRIERQIQKERENEGDEFADKEVFVTSAYKKKLEDMRLEEEKEKREEYLESIGDVTKQRDLGGFYRHLYEQKLGSDKINLDKEEKAHTETKTISEEGFKSQLKSGDKPSDSLELPKKRNYRKRKSSSDIKTLLSDGEIEDSDEEINRVNLDDIKIDKKSKQNEENIDADSDFSIDDSSDDEHTETKKNIKTSDDESSKKIDKPDLLETAHGTDTNYKGTKTNVEIKPEENQTKTMESKPKVDIWKKRTVGEVFDQALKRYYERKAARGI